MDTEHPVEITEDAITQFPPKPPPNAPVGAAWVDWQAFVLKVKCQDGTWAEVPMFRAETSLEG